MSTAFKATCITRVMKGEVWAAWTSIPRGQKRSWRPSRLDEFGGVGELTVQMHTTTVPASQQDCSFDSLLSSHEEAKAKSKAAPVTATAARSSGRGGGKGGAVRKPPADYVCHKCGAAGHWRNDCPEAARAVGKGGVDESGKGKGTGKGGGKGGSKGGGKGDAASGPPREKGDYATCAHHPLTHPPLERAAMRLTAAFLRMPPRCTCSPRNPHLELVACRPPRWRRVIPPTPRWRQTSTRYENRCGGGGQATSIST